MILRTLYPERNDSTMTNAPLRSTSRRGFLRSTSCALGAGLVSQIGLPAITSGAENSDELKIGLIGCGGRGTGAASQALQADDRRSQLVECIRVFRQALGCTGPGSHIVPLVVGEDATATRLSQQLRECGYWVPPIRPPTVPEGTARLRFSLGANMGPDQLKALAADALRLKVVS